MNNNVSKQILLSVIGVAILVIAVIGVSFALFIELKYDGNYDSDYIKFEPENDTKELLLTNSLPVSMEQGKNSSNTISFKITGKSVKYDIKIVKGEKEEGKKELKPSEVFAYISSDDVEGVTFTPSGSYGTTGQALGYQEATLGTGYFAPNNTEYRHFDIHFWVDDSVVTVGEGGTYTEEEYPNTYYSVKIKVEIPRIK